MTSFPVWIPPDPTAWTQRRKRGEKTLLNCSVVALIAECQLGPPPQPTGSEALLKLWPTLLPTPFVPDLI